MRRYRNAALMMKHVDQMLAAEHPRSQIESADNFLVDPEHQQMTEIGIGFDSLEDRDLKSLA